MSASRISSDHRLLIFSSALALLVLLVAFFLSAAGPAPDQGYPSSYSRSSDGALAAFSLLRELGYAVEHWEFPPTELPEVSEGMVLILADPFIPPSAEERSAINQFLNNGGTILFTGLAGAHLAPGGGATPLLENTEWEVLSPVLPSGLTKGAAEIKMETSARWKEEEGHLTVYAKDDNAYVVLYRRGVGRVVWWASASPLTNAGISQHQNLRFFLNSIGTSAHPRIFWDEYYHGVRRSLWSYMAATPVPWGLAQLAALLAAALFTFSRRHGPLRKLTTESRLHPLEFVHTLGALYQHAQAAPAAVGVIYKRFRHRLLRQRGLPSTLSARELHLAVRARMQMDVPQMQSTFEAAERGAAAPAMSDNQAVQLVGRLQEYAEQLRLNPSSIARKT